MLKIMGAIFVLLTTGSLGFLKGQQYKERIRYLKVLENIFLELLNDIQYGNITISESFGRISSIVPVPYDRFMKNLCGELKWKRGRAFTDIFIEEVDHCLQNTYLELTDLQKLKELGSAMDTAERKTQIHLIETYLRELKRQTENLEETSAGQQKVCQALGISGGFFLLILLL